MRLSFPRFLAASAALALSGCGVASQFEAAAPNGYSQMGREGQTSDLARYEATPAPTPARPAAEPAPPAAPPIQTQQAAPPAPATSPPPPPPPPAPPPRPTAPIPPPAPAPPAEAAPRPAPAPAPAPPPRAEPPPTPAPAPAPVPTQRAVPPAPPPPQPAPPPAPAVPGGTVPSITQPLGPPPPRSDARPFRPPPPRTGEAVASPTEVWDRLNTYLTDRGFLLAANSDRAKGIIATEPLMDGAQPLGQLADCGFNPFESPRFHTTAVEVRITPNGGGSRLSAQALFVEVRESAIRGVLVRGDCRSRGVLEDELLSLAAGGIPRR